MQPQFQSDKKDSITFKCGLLTKQELRVILNLKSTRIIDQWVKRRMISFYRLGHRTLKFSLDHVLRDLARFEIKAIGNDPHRQAFQAMATPISGKTGETRPACAYARCDQRGCSHLHDLTISTKTRSGSDREPKPTVKTHGGRRWQDKPVGVSDLAAAFNLQLTFK